MRRTLFPTIAGLISLAALAPKAYAVGGTWDATAATGSSWTNTQNWSSGAVPGSGDTGTFNTASQTSVNVGSSNQSIGLILFDGSTTGGAINSYTFSGSGGFTSQGVKIGGNSATNVSVAILNSVTTTALTTETFNTPLTISQNSGLENDAVSPTVTLDYAGGITTSQNANFALNGANIGNNIVSGLVSDGAGGKVLTLEVGNSAGGATSLNITGKWILNNTSNSFSGGVVLEGGTLSVGQIGTSGNASDLGTNGTVTLTVVNSGQGVDPILQYTGSGETSNKTFGLVNSTGGAFHSTIDLEGTGGTLTLSGSITNTGTKTNKASTLYLAGGTAQSGLVTGIISDGSTSGDTTGILKTGSNTWTLSNANTYTGGTTVNQGTLALDFSHSGAPSSNILSSSGAVTLAGGTLNVIGSATGPVSETFASTALGAGATTLSITSNSNAVAVNLGALTANSGGVLNFIQPAGTIGATNGFTTTTVNDAGGILGGWATVGGTDWAANNGTNIVAVASYTNDNWATGNNTTVTANEAPANSTTTNSLRFNASSTNTITLTGQNTITTGGILETANVGSNNELISSGTLVVSGSPTTFFITQNNTSGTLTIASTLANNGTTNLTKSGAGALYLTGSNSYSGVTTLNGGVLNAAVIANSNTASSIGTGGSSNSASTLVLNGGTLQYTGTTAASTNRNYTLLSNGGAFDASGTGAGTLTISGALTNGATAPVSTLTLTGTGVGVLSGAVADNNATAATLLEYTAVTKTGTGQWTLSGNNSYSGGTNINGGTLQVGSSTALGNGSVSFGGGTLEYAAGINTDFSSHITTGTSTSAIAINTNGQNVTFATTLTSQQSGGLTESDTNGTPGGLTLATANTYGGPTTVQSGALYLANGSGTGTTTAATNTNGSATGAGALTVNSGATLGGAGTSSSSSFSIHGTGAPRANLLVGQSSPSDTNTANSLTLLGNTTSTIANANLTFNLSVTTAGGLGTNPAGSGNELNIGGTAINFGTGIQSTVLTLNLQGTGIIKSNTPYVLIAGFLGIGNTGTGVNGSQYFNLSLDTAASSGTLSSGLITPINLSGNGQNGNLVLSMSGVSEQFYGSSSYLFLYQNSTTGVDDIEVEVVPEPSSLAMILGGLGLLVFWQVRRGKRPIGR